MSLPHEYNREAAGLGAAATQGLRRRRVWFAVLAALAVHAALLYIMGVVRPSLEPPSPDERRPVEFEILPPLIPAARRPPDQVLPRAVPAPAGVASPLQGLAAPPLAAAQAIVAPPPSAPPAPSTSYPGFFEGGLPGCGLEDIPLLDMAEKVRCRNQIDVERDRRARAAADADRAGRMQAMRQAPPIDALEPLRRAYYDAVAAASQKVREDFTMTSLPDRDQDARGLVGNFRSHVDVNVHAGCTLSFGANAAGSVVHCPVTPPTGFLTEEARTAPP